MKKIIATALIPLLLAMSACGATDESNSGGSEDVQSDGYDPSPPAQDGTVTAFYDYGDTQTIKVVDIQGTTCFLYDGVESGGIWCKDDGSVVEAPDGFE